MVQIEQGFIYITQTQVPFPPRSSITLQSWTASEETKQSCYCIFLGIRAHLSTLPNIHNSHKAQLYFILINLLKSWVIYKLSRYNLQCSKANTNWNIQIKTETNDIAGQRCASLQFMLTLNKVVVSVYTLMTLAVKQYVLRL